MRKAKFKLQVDDEFDFDLIGICSDYSDYRLCWGINQQLDVRLEKSNDYILTSKEDSQLHSMYTFDDEVSHKEIILLRNLSSEKKYLIPENSHLDFFLMLKAIGHLKTEEILQLIRSMEGVRTATMIDPAQLKSKFNLLF